MKTKLLFLALASVFSVNVWSEITCSIGAANSWNSGFVLNDIIVSNSGTTTVEDWRVALTFENIISVEDAWSASVTQDSNQRLLAHGVSYNRVLRAGEFASFGLKAQLSDGPLGTIECQSLDAIINPTPAPSPTPVATVPPYSSPTSLPGRLEVEDYINHYDTTPGNAGGSYRNDNVDIQVTSDAGGGYNVGWIARGEWLDFPVSVEQEGRYRVSYRVASLNAGGQLVLQHQGSDLGAPVNFSATGAWQNWRTVTSEVSLSAGEQVLRLALLASGFNINYLEFEWVAGPATPTPTPTSTPSVTPTPTLPPVSDNHDDWLHTEGNQIHDRNGNPVWLTGTNWFGFNTGTNAFDGLWSVNLEQAIAAMAQRGINFLRVPISTELVWRWSQGDYPMPKSINTSANPNLAGKNSLEVFERTLVVARANGMKIMLDFHSAMSDPMGHMEPLWYQGEMTTEHFYLSWEWLAQRYKNNDTILAFDLENEPHGQPWQGAAALWDGSDHPNNWQAVAQEAARRILAIHPNILIMVEGNESTPKPGKTYASTNPADYFTTWWGGNLREVRNHPIDLGQHQDKLVYSPHDYGPLVYRQPWFNKPFDKNTLNADVWYPNWGFIMEENIAPLLIGEWGGFMDGGDNQKWMEALRDYIVENKVHHTFWCFNANSGDTGGLVGDDFRTWDEEKYALLLPSLWRAPNGEFVGLDHKIPLGGVGSDAPVGMTVTRYYAQEFPPPVR